MTQSASSPYPIRPIEENELDDFLNVDENAFNKKVCSGAMTLDAARAAATVEAPSAAAR